MLAAEVKLGVLLTVTIYRLVYGFQHLSFLKCQIFLISKYFLDFFDMYGSLVCFWSLLSIKKLPS